MKNYLSILFIFTSIQFSLSQIVTPVKEIQVCDYDGDGYVQIPFSQLQNYALDILSDFNESPEIYVTKAHRGIEKIINLYDNPQIVNVCGDVDGAGGYYDIALNSQKEIYITRKNGVLQKVNPDNCNYQTLGQIHPNGQTVLALSFDHLDYLYEGGWTSKVYRSHPQNITEFHLWHDFGVGNASGDFVQIGDFMYVAWTMPDGKDHLLKVTLGNNNDYVSHQDMGKIETGTFGLAAEYGRLYGNTVDGLYEINLNTMERTLIKERPQNGSAGNWWGAAGYHEAMNFQISYHDSQADATTGANPLSDPFTNQVPFEDAFVYIRVHESTQNITYIIPVRIVINIPPAAENSSLTSCANPDTGMADFDLTEAITDINPNQNLNFKFYNNLQDLHAGQNPLPGNITTSQDKTIFVKVDDNNQDCYGIAELKLIIPKPEVNYESELAFCKGTEVVLSVPDIFTTYEWIGIHEADMNQPLNENEVIVSQPGDYSVIVTDLNGCTHRLPFTVSFGSSPQVSNVIINSDNSITVQVTPSGIYEYSLDGIFWQKSPTFYGIQPEDYDIHVRDLVGCYSDIYKFTYFLIPNFISPNGDGFNDEWKIRGMAQYPSATIQIFDRYGKLFVNRKINSAEIIWNGKYMGNTVASGTYWYILKLDENQIIKGHINVRN